MDDLLAADCSMLDALAADPPAGPAALAARAGEQYPAANDEQRRRLEYLLDLLGTDGDAVLLDLLARLRTARLLAEVVRRGLPVPEPVLDQLVKELGYQPPVIDAAGLSGDRRRAKALGALLKDDDLCGRAALALARLGAREWTVPIARRLSAFAGLKHVFLTVALEEMGDPAAVPVLLDWLANGPELPAGDVHRALVRLSGRSPLLPSSADIRQVWAGLDLTAEPVPRVRDVAVDSPSALRFSVDEGRARVRVEFDPALPGSMWPRWDQTLRVGEQARYGVGSGCETCETTLRLLGFGPAEALAGAAQVREVLAEPRELGTATVRALEPLLQELETGHYRMLLADLPLERVRTAEQSWWWVRRTETRSAWEGDPDWPGIEHFQLPRAIPGEMPTYGSVVPSQPLDALDPATVDRYAEAIDRGERPAALLLAWAEDRYVSAQWPERFVLGIILDGHHRLAAYAAAGVPARLVLLVRGESGETVEEVVRGYARLDPA
ncbi:hypothetical protein F9C11_16415 [Amycolatopsis sp. VS8301801F10]|uniref:hypothetical protein n=1 Tax=Amycolatopsis sp. VS8301801F10 TaxID=2652442 RepID=UPI0038FCE6B8